MTHSPIAGGSVPMPDTVDAPTALERLVSEADNAGASDIHLHTTPDGVRVHFRLDGVLQPVTCLPAEPGARVLGRIKYLARLRTYQDLVPQDGRIDRGDLHARTDLRVATYPTVTGEKIVLRLFREARIPDPDRIGLTPEVHAALDTALRRPSGLILLTGPAGSGKTTTIYACLQALLTLGGRHIITVEDPVEQILPGIMQTEIHEARGLGYADATRHLLRQDPQVLMIGEIRDEETARLVVRAALTGHLVLSTLHAGSCRGVLDRLLNLCPDPATVAAALSLVVNQRLLRRRCMQCAGAGCPACLETGYRGRIPVVEHLVLDDTRRALLRAGQPEALRTATTLHRAADLLIRSGDTTAAECERVLGPDPDPLPE